MRDDASIAIDLGGTIEDTWQQKRYWFASRGFDLGPYPLSRREVISRTGGGETLYLQMVESVYSDERILTHPLCAGSDEALRIIARRFSIVLLSSRPESQRQVTLEWLCKTAILNMIAEVALIGGHSNKLKWCHLHNISILVDDDLRHLEPDEVNIETTRIHYAVGRTRPQRLNSQILVASTWSEVCQLVATLQGANSAMAPSTG